MIVVPYRAEHMSAIDAQAGQAYVGAWVTPDLAKALEGTDAFTGMVDGRVIIVAGLVQQWHGRALTWAYLDRNAGEHMVAIHKAVKRYLDLQVGMRIEATVDCEFEPGHRWVRMLGFELECERMKRYLPTGGDSALYAKVM